MADIRDDYLHSLRQMVHNDPELQARLFNISDANEFIAAVQQLAQAQGYAPEQDEVQQAIRHGRRLWADRQRA